MARFALDRFPPEQPEGVFQLRTAFQAGIVSSATEVIFEPIAESMVRAHLEYDGVDPDIEPIDALCWMSCVGPDVRPVRHSTELIESLERDPSIIPDSPARRDEAIRNKTSYITEGEARWVDVSLPTLIEATHLMNGGVADRQTPAATIDLSLDSIQWTVDCALDGERLVLHGLDRVHFEKAQLQRLFPSLQGLEMSFGNGVVYYRPPRVSLWRRLFATARQIC